MPEEGKFIANAVNLKILEKNQRPLTVLPKFKLIVLEYKTCWRWQRQLPVSTAHLSRDKNQKQKLFAIFVPQVVSSVVYPYTWALPLPSFPTNLQSFFPFLFWTMMPAWPGECFLLSLLYLNVPSGAAWQTECKDLLKCRKGLGEMPEEKHAEKPTRGKLHCKQELMFSKILWLVLRDCGPSPDCTIYTMTFFILILFDVYGWFDYMYVFAPHKCPVPLEVRKEHKIFWKWNYRWLWAAAM